MSIFGYFEQATDTAAAFDPGLDVLCPFCLRTLSKPLMTISLMGMERHRSYFYRAHKPCYEGASDEAISQVESSVIDGTTSRTGAES